MGTYHEFYCGQFVHHPQYACPKCGSANLVFIVQYVDWKDVYRGYVCDDCNHAYDVRVGTFDYDNNCAIYEDGDE